MSKTVLLGLTSFEKIGGQWILGGPVTFQIYWASGSRSLMLRAAYPIKSLFFYTTVYGQFHGKGCIFLQVKIA